MNVWAAVRWWRYRHRLFSLLLSKRSFIHKTRLCVFCKGILLFVFVLLFFVFTGAASSKDFKAEVPGRGKELLLFVIKTTASTSGILFVLCSEKTLFDEGCFKVLDEHERHSVAARLTCSTCSQLGLNLGRKKKKKGAMQERGQGGSDHH